MRRTASRALFFGAILVTGASVRAAPPPPTPPAPVRPPTDEPDLEDDLDDLAARVQALEARLQQSEDLRRNATPRVRIGGYADVGLFIADGDGSGVRRDVGYVNFPQYSNYGWVFYGDLLATQINSRGEVADLGQLPGVTRFDSVHAGSNLSFIVNELNLNLQVGLADNALFTASVNFVPRSGHDFALGDFIDVDIVQLEWLPTEDQHHSIFVGKVDSVLGIEYRERKADQRFGIIPSLIARYTTGTAIGIKVRSKLWNEHLILAAALTNGSFGTEQFHFYQEIDTNSAKTVSGRGALRFALGDGTFELGGSGQAGTQDGGPDGSGTLWFVGADLQVLFPSVELRAEWLKGHSPGDAESQTYALDLKTGGYVELDIRLGPVLGLWARGELRDALVSQALDRIYVTQSWRAVGGARLTLGPHVVVKVEAIHNGEYGAVPSIPNDVLTSSLVLTY